MKYVLDTNILSLAMAGDATVCDRLLTLPRSDVLLPQPVIAEVEYGIARLAISKRRDLLRKRLDIFLDQMKRAAWTDDVSLVFGQIKASLEQKGVRIEDFDVAIAAHALARDATLVSDNLEHMQRVQGLQGVNWRSR